MTVAERAAWDAIKHNDKLWTMAKKVAHAVADAVEMDTRRQVAREYTAWRDMMAMDLGEDQPKSGNR